MSLILQAQQSVRRYQIMYSDFNVGVETGSNYFMHSEKGNACLRKFIESANGKTTVTVDPSSKHVVEDYVDLLKEHGCFPNQHVPQGECIRHRHGGIFFQNAQNLGGVYMGIH